MPDSTVGSVNIANDVLADLAGYACLESYGVVGMASPSLKDGVAVDLYVIIEFGTNLTEVSHNLSNRVRYVLTNNADVKVASVDVHVQGVKVRNPV